MNAINKHRRFSVITLGCRVNQCESDSLAQQLKDAGWRPGKPGAEHDLVIVNTCTVTAKAAMQSRQAARRAVREHPGARIVVTGCCVQIAADDLNQIQGVDYVCGNAEKHRIPEWVARPDSGRQEASVPEIESWRGFDPIRMPQDASRTRPVLKIQDGCNSFCTYCIVPYARGRSRSMPEDDVIGHIRSLEAAGFKEVVLSGIHIGAYGADADPKRSLLALLKRVEAETAISRIRLSSIEPNELSPEIIGLVAGSPRFCRHFHIPLQSGDNGILKRMHRPYSAEFFEELVLRIKQRMPDAAVGADVLIGFPGETDEAFHRTFRMIDALPVSYLHVFPFSPRNGTAAAKMPGQVPGRVAGERCRRMREMGQAKKRNFYASFVGQKLDVVVEARRETKSGLLTGVSSNYLKVLIDGPDSLKNEKIVCRASELLETDALFCSPAAE